ncbi:MAG: hypothetical protein QXF28_07120 [Nitrososphaerota archaeon]
MSLGSRAREKVEQEFKELEDRLMKEINKGLEELKEEVRKASKSILR